MTATGRDETAHKAIRNVEKGGRTRHAYWCRVDGGSLVHGANGFHCPRCAEIHADRELDVR